MAEANASGYRKFCNYLENPHFVSIWGSGGEVVTSPPLDRKVGSSRPTIIRACCLSVKQHYPAQKNHQKIACSS